MILSRFGLSFIFFSAIYITSFSQTLKGRIIDIQGEPLPYASIMVRNSELGAVSNQEGYYQLQLEDGNSKIRIQYVGFRTIDTTITLGSSVLTLNFRMTQESLSLPTVVIDGQKEDPAYTIMRRAIGKASYHANQINAYKARVYIKGSGRILKVPFLFKNKIKKELAKEGIDSTVAFTQESVSRLNYKRPGQYKDTVISMRATGEDNNTSPMSFVYSSFYDPKVSGSVSPLAPNAFQIYKFEYLGYIEDHGAVINKIKVTPRGRGDQVFEGLLYITDQVWSIHSLDLITSIWGIQFSIKQVFSPVQTDVWMPIDQIYDVKGDVFGFGFSYKYLAHVSDYKITLNPDVQLPIVVLDDKLNKEESLAANAVIQKNADPFNLKSLNPGQELSAKQLRKMMKEYDKQEKEKLPNRDTATVFHESQQVIDSLANRRDSVYWTEVRPVPLTSHEIKGYSRLDSVVKKQAAADQKKKESKKDSSSLTINIGSGGTDMTINKVNKGFKLQHLITGGSYNFNDKQNYFKIYPTLTTLNFNTVDGYRVALISEFGNRASKTKPIQWKLQPDILYAFSRKDLNYQVTGTLFRNETKQFKHPWSWRVAGGQYAESFNKQLPINSILNTTHSLLFKKNYLKLYDKNFFRTAFTIKANKSTHVTASLEWADRHELANTTNHSYFYKQKDYSSNTPELLDDDPVNVNSNKAFISNFEVKWTPFYTIKAQNGYKTEDRSMSPVFTIQYSRGWDLGSSQFDKLSLGIIHHIHIGAGDDFDYTLSGGYIPSGHRPTFFHDFVHFPGNQYIFSPTDPNKYFRMLDYFQYSTDRHYASLLSNYQFRRFLFTTSPWVRRKGIRENIILNALSTKQNPMYGELGYSINYLFRFLRIEAVTSWKNAKYHDFAIRFGIATGFENLFKF